jgi:hypothetical protein
MMWEENVIARTERTWQSHDEEQNARDYRAPLGVTGILVASYYWQRTIKQKT